MTEEHFDLPFRLEIFKKRLEIFIICRYTKQPQSHSTRMKLQKKKKNEKKTKINIVVNVTRVKPNLYILVVLSKLKIYDMHN